MNPTPDGAIVNNFVDIEGPAAAPSPTIARDNPTMSGPRISSGSGTRDALAECDPIELVIANVLECAAMAGEWSTVAVRAPPG